MFPSLNETATKRLTVTDQIYSGNLIDKLWVLFWFWDIVLDSQFKFVFENKVCRVNWVMKNCLFFLKTYSQTHT